MIDSKRALRGALWVTLVAGFVFGAGCKEASKQATAPAVDPATLTPTVGTIDCREVAERLWDLTGLVGQRDEVRVKTGKNKSIKTNPRKNKMITHFLLTCNQRMDEKARACVLKAESKKQLNKCEKKN